MTYLEVYSLKNHLESLKPCDHVILLTSEDLQHPYCTTVKYKNEDQLSTFLCGVSVTSFLIDREIFKLLSTTTLLFLLTRIRGERVIHDKSKIGILDNNEGLITVSWF